MCTNGIYLFCHRAEYVLKSFCAAGPEGNVKVKNTAKFENCDFSPLMGNSSLNQSI